MFGACKSIASGRGGGEGGGVGRGSAREIERNRANQTTTMLLRLEASFFCLFLSFCLWGGGVDKSGLLQPKPPSWSRFSQDEGERMKLAIKDMTKEYRKKMAEEEAAKKDGPPDSPLFA